MFLPLIVGSVTDLSQHKYFGKKKKYDHVLVYCICWVFFGGGGGGGSCPRYFVNYTDKIERKMFRFINLKKKIHCT